MIRRIVIPGCSGAVGQVLARHFHRRSVSRRHLGTAWHTVEWNGATLGPWAREIDGADIVINLAGRSVDCRYSEANRREILNSRIHSKIVVGQAIAAADRPPAVWLNAGLRCPPHVAAH